MIKTIKAILALPAQVAVLQNDLKNLRHRHLTAMASVEADISILREQAGLPFLTTPVPRSTRRAHNAQHAGEATKADETMKAIAEKFASFDT